MTHNFRVVGKYIAPSGHSRYTDVLISVEVTLNSGGLFEFDPGAIAIDTHSAQLVREALKQHVSRDRLRNRGIVIRLVAIQPDLDWLVPLGCARAAEIVAAKINEELKVCA
jgi:hypothetical protein